MLDSDTSRILERMARDLSEAPAEPSIEDRRNLMRRMALAYGPAPAPVARIEDRLIAGRGGPIPLRIYWPAAPVFPTPLLLHIHGGGWALGDPEAYEPICRAYASAGGCIVIDVHYRRAPEHKYPAALEDCQTALVWAARNAVELGGDPACIAVTGDSAGGNLAAALCQRASVSLALQILVYPVMSALPDAYFASRVALGDGRYFLRESDIKQAENDYLEDPRDGHEPGASPLLASEEWIARSPPTLILTAEFDPLRDEGATYAERLTSCHVPTSYECVQGTIHAFVLFAGAIAKGAHAIGRIGVAIQGIALNARAAQIHCSAQPR